MRPPSIVTFERCYLGSIAVWLLGALAFWPATIAAMRASPAVAQMGPGFAPAMLGVGIAIGTVVSVLLWYFAARAGSVVAKWTVVVFFAFGVVSLLYGMVMGTRPLNVQGTIGLVSIALDAAAVWMLFRPDARLWFGEDTGLVSVDTGETL